jgi:hypothetical protein
MHNGKRRNEGLKRSVYVMHRRDKDNHQVDWFALLVFNYLLMLPVD